MEKEAAGVPRSGNLEISNSNYASISEHSSHFKVKLNLNGGKNWKLRIRRTRSTDTTTAANSCP
jgi:hypothetical protein